MDGRLRSSAEMSSVVARPARDCCHLQGGGLARALACKQSPDQSAHQSAAPDIHSKRQGATQVSALASMHMRTKSQPCGSAGCYSCVRLVTSAACRVCTAACCALLDCYVTAPQTHLAVLYCVCLTASSSRLSGQHFGLPPRALVASVVVWPHDLHRAYHWLSQADLKSFTVFRSSMPLPSLVFQSSMFTSTISPAGNPLMMLRSVCKVSATWFSVSKSTVFLGDEAHAAFNAWFF